MRTTGKESFAVLKDVLGRAEKPDSCIAPFQTVVWRSTQGGLKM